MKSGVLLPLSEPRKGKTHFSEAKQKTTERVVHHGSYSLCLKCNCSVFPFALLKLAFCFLYPWRRDCFDKVGGTAKKETQQRAPSFATRQQETAGSNPLAKRQFMTIMTTTTPSTSTTLSNFPLEDRAAVVFVEQGLCSSLAEAQDVVSAMMVMMMQNNGNNCELWQDRDAFEEAILTCFDVPDKHQLDSMFDAIVVREKHQDESKHSVEEKESPVPQTTQDDNDDEYIGEGECQLCERQTLLTRHHLIPRSTWPRLETRILHALGAWQKARGEKSDVLGEGLQHLLLFVDDDATTSDRATQRQYVRHALGQVCFICRQCHSAVHRTHDNMTLALSFNTVDKLIADPAIYKFAKWASSQRPKGRKYK